MQNHNKYNSTSKKEITEENVIYRNSEKTLSL